MLQGTIRILHGADLHLDSPFRSLSPEKAALRREELRALPEMIANTAVKAQADLLLLSGDLLDSENTGRETVKALASALGEISIPVFIAPGNHDCFSLRSPWSRIEFPENVYIFTEREIRCVELPELGARIWGGAFRQQREAGMLVGFSTPKSEGILDIMVLHGDVVSPGGTSDYNPVTRDEIAKSGMDYMALGHAHSFSGLQKAGNTFYAWPGTTMGRGFDEPGEKGLIFADLRSGDCQMHFLPLGGRRYESIELDITDVTPAEALRAALPPEPGRDIYRISFRGECDDPPNLKSLSGEFDWAFFHLELSDKTRLRRDLWEKSDESSLRGLFLARLRKMYDEAQTEEEKELIMLAARQGLAALDNEDDFS